MPVFLFQFGYESYGEREQNERDGTDFESGHAVWIDAQDEAEALSWGCEIAEQFYRQIWPGRSWRDDNYAYWTEPWLPMDHVFPIVKAGELPDFSGW